MRMLSPFEKIGLGLAAGLVGTVVMTLGQRAEMALTERPPSKVPAQALETITRTDLRGRAEERLSTATHLLYGTALGGALLALLDEVPEPKRTAALYAGAQAVGGAILQTLDLEGKPSEWGAEDAAVDAGHHLVFAVAAGLAYTVGKRLLARMD